MRTHMVFDDLMSYEAIGIDGYYTATYNGISIVVDEDLEHFRLNDIIKSLKSKVGVDKPSTDAHHWMNGKVGSRFYNTSFYHDQFYLKEGSWKVSGWYAPMVLFDAILYSIEPLKAHMWVMGMEWKEPEDGELYLVHIGKNIYKYGRTWNMNQRINGYSDEVVVIRTVDVSNTHAAERILLLHAEQNFEKDPLGKEYFQIDDIDEAITIFNKAIVEIRSKGM